MKKKWSPREWADYFETEAFADEFHYDGKDLGACYQKEGTVFRIWAPVAEGAWVNLYRTGSDMEQGADLVQRVEMSRQEKGCWMAAISGDWKGIYYTYEVVNEGKKKECGDPYARACGVNGKRSMVVELADTDPDGWKEDENFIAVRKRLAEKPVIWEVHIKDFSNDRHSGIHEEHRGKYLAFTDEDSTLDGAGAVPTCVNYLKELGVTHVHLLPFYDYGSVAEDGNLLVQFNWGYDPVNYNVPEGSYSTNPYDGKVRIQECKRMIQGLHKAGIAVVMDVVYNHTYSSESVFEAMVPYYYYRLDEKGCLGNGSMCGNDTASDHEMYRRYMMDSVCYWAKEYHIDGFRFDLMGLHDVDTMNQIRMALNELAGGETILMYGEPWAGDYSPMRNGYVPALKEHADLLMDGISFFCDSTRDSIKGSVFVADEAGFVNGEKNLEEDIFASVCGWKDAEEFHPNHPGQIISYVSAHDNYSLWDKLYYTEKDSQNKKSDQIVFQQRNASVYQKNKMAAGIYFTCLGIPFMQAGEEFGRTKLGVADSYLSPPSLNQLDWRRSYEYRDLVEYYRGLIQLRKGFTPFYVKDYSIVSNIHRNLVEEKQVVSYCIANTEEGMCKGDRWKELCVIYNANEEKIVYDLPAGAWEMISDGERISVSGPWDRVQEQLIVKGSAVTILGRRTS